MLKQAASVVLDSSKSSTGTRPPHHSAARTDLVLLIRRTVRPRGYASVLHSLRPCWTGFLNSLLALWCLIMLGLATPVLMYVSKDGPMDMMKYKASQVEKQHQNRAQQIP